MGPDTEYELYPERWREYEKSLIEPNRFVLLVSHFDRGCAPSSTQAKKDQDSDSVKAEVAVTQNAAASERVDGGSPAAAQPLVKATNSLTTPESTSTSTALKSIFSPWRAPERKTMGLLQRSFLDLADQAIQPLQVALVIDGTDSMADELDGVRNSIHQMLADLKRCRGDRVEVAIVVYRDSQSPSGEVTHLIERFTEDNQAIEEALKQLKPEIGAPFFHELADVGLYHAIDQLPWSNDPSVTRWILMFGDAPPYEVNTAIADYPQAKRRYSNDVLIANASRKDIRINCILCPSGKDVAEPFQQALEQTRAFMSEVSTGTDGLMLDLSYADIRNALVEAGKKPEANYVAIDRITEEDLSAQRLAMGIDGASRKGEESASAMRDVRLAIVPHLPLERMSFSPQDPAVQISTALRDKLAGLKHVRIVTPLDVQQMLRRIRADGIPEEQQLRALAARLRADYVVWGQLDTKADLVRTVAYHPTHQAPVLQVSYKSNDGKQLTKVLLEAVSAELPEAGADLGRTLKQLQAEDVKESFEAPLAKTPATTRQILATIEALQQAVGYSVGANEGIELLKQAQATCDDAALAEPRNPVIHWLVSNIAYNQSMNAYQHGELEAGEAGMAKMLTALRTAHRERQAIKSEALRTEIEADFALLVEKKFDIALERYDRLTEATAPNDSQRRAHWMRSGILAGDWNAPKEIVNVSEARKSIIAILAGWDDSAEAKLLRAWLRWDDTSRQTRFNFLPRRSS